MSESDVVNASPTKSFFVRMLTRDIALSDAILDLIDNSLDGALRLSAGRNPEYDKYIIKITLNSDRFQIEDNCGGIPRDIAINYAFKMGRDPDDERDSDTETIGSYGIGMKRAIFKMGKSAVVKTMHDKDSYQIPIAETWLNEQDWTKLPLEKISSLGFVGTVIEVEKLYDGVSKHFRSESFKNELISSIGHHFTSFIEKGLVVKVNDIKVEPSFIRILMSNSNKGPAPYFYKKTIDDVEVTITVGLNASDGISSDDEGGDDTNPFTEPRTLVSSGWTIFCNDRAIIVGDKTRLTGWGDGLPLFHAQFSIITGIVDFRSTNVDKLPITTTKRDLDTSSDIWLETRNKMKEGLRIWVNYTNKWKNFRRNAQTEYWKEAKPLSIADIAKTVERIKPVKKSPSGESEYNPLKTGEIPQPPSDKPSIKRIVFTKSVEEIKFISEELFDSPEEPPSQVGERCFDKVYKDLKSKRN
jgi:hypothetical protein